MGGSCHDYNEAASLVFFFYPPTHTLYKTSILEVDFTTMPIQVLGVNVQIKPLVMTGMVALSLSHRMGSCSWGIWALVPVTRRPLTGSRTHACVVFVCVRVCVCFAFTFGNKIIII